MARIRVFNRATGQIGSVSEEFYNPTKYQRVGGEARMPQSSPSLSYAPAPVTTDLQGQQGPTLQGFLQNVGRNVGDFGQGIGNLAQMAYKLTPISYLLNPNKEQAKQETLGAYKQLGQTAVNLPGAVISDLGSLVSNPLDYAYNKPLDAILNVLPLLSGAKTVGRLGKAALLGKEALGTVGKEAASVAGREAVGEAGQVVGRSRGLLDYLIKGRTGKALEEEASLAGKSPVVQSMLESKFGTISSPNLKLIEGLAPAGKQQELVEALRQEIMNQGRTPGGVVTPPSYSDILNFRKGAYEAGFEKTAPKSLQSFYKRLGGAYSDILHEGVPSTVKLDKAFSILSQIKGAGGTLKKSAQFILTAKLLNNILGGVGGLLQGE